MCTVFGLAFWLVFFRFRWLEFSIAWGVVAAFFVAHLLLIFMIGLRFVTPASTHARMIQHTIQIVPRLDEPTLVTGGARRAERARGQGPAALPVRSPTVRDPGSQDEATLAAARQNAPILDTQTIAAEQSPVEGAGPARVRAPSRPLRGAGAERRDLGAEEAQRANAQLAADDGGRAGARGDRGRARSRDAEQIGGVNTAVLQAQAELDLAQFYLDNTTLVAPEDGRIVNLQVRPGMVSGEYRVGAIASFICDADRYLLANYFQEHLKYVELGQPVEVAFDLYPGQIFPGKVASIWRASGSGPAPAERRDAASSTRRRPTFRRASSPSRSSSTTPISRSSRWAPRASRRSTPAAAASRCCAASRSARTRG